MRAELITTRCDFWRKREDANLFLHIRSVSLQTTLDSGLHAAVRVCVEEEGWVKRERETQEVWNTRSAKKKEKKEKEKENRRGKVDGPKVIVAG